jgi:beta-1,4-N-acetylglucosaminyltransferase
MRQPLSEPDNGRRDLLLVADPGGHLQELLALEEVWRGHTRAWVTVDNETFRAIGPAELVFSAHGPTRRNLVNLLRNTVLAARVIRAVRPQAIVTTGAGLSVPFVWVARALRVRTAYIECSGRVGVSLSGRLAAPAANRVYVQWPDAVGIVAKAAYRGSIFFSPR